MYFLIFVVSRIIYIRMSILYNTNYFLNSIKVFFEILNKRSKCVPYLYTCNSNINVIFNIILY